RDRALGVGDEFADRIDFITEEFHADGIFAGIGENIQDTAAASKLSRLFNKSNGLIFLNHKLYAQIIKNHSIIFADGNSCASKYFGSNNFVKDRFGGAYQYGLLMLSDIFEHFRALNDNRTVGNLLLIIGMLSRGWKVVGIRNLKSIQITLHKFSGFAVAVDHHNIAVFFSQPGYQQGRGRANKMTQQRSVMILDAVVEFLPGDLCGKGF